MRHSSPSWGAKIYAMYRSKEARVRRPPGDGRSPNSICIPNQDLLEHFCMRGFVQRKTRKSGHSYQEDHRRGNSRRISNGIPDLLRLNFRRGVVTAERKREPSDSGDSGPRQTGEHTRSHSSERKIALDSEESRAT